MNFFGQCFKLRFPIELMLNWMATQNMTALYLKGDRVRFTNLLTVLVRYAQAWAYGIHFAAFVLPVENLSLDMVIRLERFTIENRWQWFDISFLKCKMVRILIFPRHLKPWLFFVVQEIRYIQWEMKWNDHGIRRKSIGSPCSRFPPFFYSPTIIVLLDKNSVPVYCQSHFFQQNAALNESACEKGTSLSIFSNQV